MKTYSVKEIFYTLQGEGANAGTPAVFIRFAGCNLWTGREEDRENAICKFCDTDFVGTDGPDGGKFDAVSLALAARKKGDAPLAVCTGGEPLLQLDEKLIEALHEKAFHVAVETNGTIETPEGIDWLCVSPKIGAKLVLKRGDELKLVYPQDGGDPAQFERLDFQHFYLQPMDGPDLERNTRLSIEYCLTHPKWRLSIQSHKVLGIR
jgi:7-carboxy-7-deazaguanine synthase (Cx14CxxC type)